MRIWTRHGVDIPCEVIGERDDAPRLMWATDMSAGGAWLDSRELAVVWWRAREIQVFAEVVRVSQGQRGPDDVRGAGVRFLDLTGAQRWALRCWLRPRPQALAHRRRWPKLPDLSPALAAMVNHPFAARLA